MADSLIGSTGENRLEGRGGADTLIGFTGVDQLAGGDGQDDFVYVQASDTGVGAGQRDIILDFSQSEFDQIEVSISYDGDVLGEPDHFVFIAENDFTGGNDGEIRYFFDGENTIVQGELGVGLLGDNDSTVDFEIQVVGNISFQAADFDLIG